MNNRYLNAVNALQEHMDSAAQAGMPVTEAGAHAAMQTQAILAVADEQTKTNELLETANLIAYAQLRRDRRRPSLATEEIVDRRMAVFPEISDEFEDEL